MMRFLLTLSLVSILAPATAEAADCSQSSIQLETPGVPENQIKQNCNGSALCESSYTDMWKQYHQTSLNYDSACNSIQSVPKNNPGIAPDKLGTMMADQTTASVTKLDSDDTNNQKSMSSYRDKLLAEMQKEADASTDDTVKTQTQQLTAKLKGHDTLDKQQVSAYISDANKSSLSPAGKANYVAAVRSMRFKTSISDQTNDEKTRLNEVAASQTTMAANQANLNTPGGGSPPNSNVSKGDSGFGMSDAMKMAPLATAGLGVMAMLQSQSSANSDSATPTADNTSAAGLTQTASLPSATNMGSTNPGSAGGTSFSEATSASSTPNKTAAKTAAADNNSASSTPEALRALASNGQFSGSLGGSPFSGSSSSGAALGLGASPSDSKPNADATADTKKSTDAGYVVPGGGSAPSFAGGSPATTAVDNSLKDLFKNDVMPTMPDPKAMFPGMEGGATAAQTTGGSTNEGFAGVDSSEGGGNSGTQMQGSVPGAFDTRSLFARVHDYHRRCIKKGCVTSEAGGKI